MRAVAIILLACVSCIAGLFIGDSFSHNDGRPACIENAEFQQKWRNNFDNVRYWVCREQGAVSYICPTEFLFSYERQCCINWNFWVWSEPFDPINLAA